jgi:cytoskeletal protein RodZ
MLGSMSDDHDQLDPAEALRREVGAQLRQVRLERGQDLDEVGQQLRIKSTYLLGIEEGDLSMMPGRTYALGFLRSYADYLGFDGEDLIVQIKSTVADLTDKTRLRMRTPLPESRLPKTPILVLSLVAVAAIYGGWTYLHRGSQLALETEFRRRLRTSPVRCRRRRPPGSSRPRPRPRLP